MRKNKYLCILIIALVVLACGVSLFTTQVGKDDKNKSVVIYETEKDFVSQGDSSFSETVSGDGKVEPDDSIIMITEYSEEKAELQSCDAFVCALFSGSKYDISVYESIQDSITSKVSAVSPSSGFIARQANINYSGITEADEEGNVGYIAIVDVYCLDLDNNSYSYDIVVKMDLDSSKAVSNFELYMFK